MFDESKINRVPKGNADGGRFTSKDGAGGTHEATDAEKERLSNFGISETTNDYSIGELLGKEYTGVKGRAAIDKLLKEKQGYVKAAFHRDDIGDIDLLWGNDSLGLQHIIKQREKQGINITSFLDDITDVIEKGQFYQKSDRGNFEFLHNGKMAIIAP